MKVVGVREVNYISKKTGKEVHGYEIYGTYPSQRMLYGEMMAREYISAASVEKNGGQLPQVGENFRILSGYSIE